MVLYIIIHFFFIGAIWTKEQTKFDWWTVEIIFRINGRGRIGADGLVSMLIIIMSIVYSLNENIVFLGILVYTF